MLTKRLSTATRSSAPSSRSTLITGDNVEEMKATFIDGKPEYDFNNLDFCVMADYATFEELAAK